MTDLQAPSAWLSSASSTASLPSAARLSVTDGLQRLGRLHAAFGDGEHA